MNSTDSNACRTSSQQTWRGLAKTARGDGAFPDALRAERFRGKHHSVLVCHGPVGELCGITSHSIFGSWDVGQREDTQRLCKFDAGHGTRCRQDKNSDEGPVQLALCAVSTFVTQCQSQLPLRLRWHLKALDALCMFVQVVVDLQTLCLPCSFWAT